MLLVHDEAVTHVSVLELAFDHQEAPLDGVKLGQRSGKLLKNRAFARGPCGSAFELATEIHDRGSLVEINAKKLGSSWG